MDGSKVAAALGPARDYEPAGSQQQVHPAPLLLLPQLYTAAGDINVVLCHPAHVATLCTLIGQNSVQRPIGVVQGMVHGDTWRGM